MSLRSPWLRVATWSLVAVVAAGLFVVFFQAGMRYRYEELGGVLWRIDQLTNQRCRVIAAGSSCVVVLPKSTSVSKSISTSTSTSISLTVKRAKN